MTRAFSGTCLGPYTIVEPIGSGGMGEVYRAHDPRLSRDIALKVLARVDDSELRRRFESEARAASALTHPNIVVVHDIGDEGGIAYIAMELVEGQTLRAAAGTALPLDRLLAIAVQIADALRTAHARGIAHRDLKPENVLITSSSVVKVVDFGLAKLRAVDADATVSSTRDGSDPWHAGEHVAGTGSRPALRRSLGSVRVRRPALRTGHGPARLPQGLAARNRGGDACRGSDADFDAAARAAGPAGVDHPAMSGKGSGSALRHH